MLKSMELLLRVNPTHRGGKSITKHTFIIREVCGRLGSE